MARGVAWGIKGWKERGWGWGRTMFIEKVDGLIWCRVGLLYYRNPWWIWTVNTYLQDKLSSLWKKFVSAHIILLKKSCRKSERIWKMRLMSKNGWGISNDHPSKKEKGGMKIAWVNWGVNFITDLRVSSFGKVSCLNRCRKFGGTESWGQFSRQQLLAGNWSELKKYMNGNGWSFFPWVVPLGLNHALISDSLNLLSVGDDAST